MSEFPHATEADNRGTEDVPYGFVYFSDGMRVAYTGRSTDNGMEYDVSDTSGGWGEVTQMHRVTASEFLRSGA